MSVPVRSLSKDSVAVFATMWALLGVYAHVVVHVLGFLVLPATNVAYKHLIHSFRLFVIEKYALVLRVVFFGLVFL